MATATILLRYQQDCLRRNQFGSETLTSSSSRHRRGPNPNSMHSRRRKRSPVGFRENGQDRTVALNFPPKNRVIGQVKILKRGEGFKPATNPEPRDKIQKQIRISDFKVVDGVYAGSTVFLASPPPSSLPFPEFLAKKENNIDAMTSNCRAVASTRPESGKFGGGESY